MKFCLFFAGLLCCSSFFAQSFVNVASQQNLNVVNSAPVLGSGVSFYDYNGDSWPDLTYCVNGVGIVRYENIEGAFVSDDLIPMSWGDPKTATYADYDNDGDADLLVTRRAANPILFRKDPEGFVNVSAEAGMPVVTAPHSYGACWGDYDKDGFLDCYIANYNWNVGPHNWLMHNNGDGTFTEVAVAAGVDNGQMPSFQAVFTDINRDSWPDLFLINDKAPTNVIYINNGDGTFSDRSAEMNLDYVMDAMSQLAITIEMEIWISMLPTINSAMSCIETTATLLVILLKNSISKWASCAGELFGWITIIMVMTTSMY